MGGTGDLATAAHDVGPDRIGKTVVGYFWRSLVQESRLDVIRFQRAANRLVHSRVNFERGLREERVGFRNDQRISEIIAVRNDPASSPAANDFPLIRLPGGFRV